MASTVDGTLNLSPTIKQGETPVAGEKREGPWKRTPNMLIPEKQIAMDEPGGSLQYIADIATKTPTNAFNLIGVDSYRTPMTINIQASAARSEGGVPVVYPNEVRFEFDTTHVGIGGYCRASADATAVTDAASVYAGNFFFNGTSMYKSEGGTLLKDHVSTNALSVSATNLAQIFASKTVAVPLNLDENICQRRNPAYTSAATITADKAAFFHLPTMARNTRLEIFSSVELKFNNSTTVMKVNEPGRLYRYVNDFYGPKALFSDSCGDITTCPTQYNFPKTLWGDTTRDPAYETDPLVEVTNPILGDQRRYHAGEWFEGSKIGDNGKYTVYLADIFPAFDKDELMSMPSFTITFNFAENFREKFTVYPNTYIATSTTDTAIAYSPTTYVEVPATYSTTFDQSNTGTAFAYKHTDYFGIVGCTYKAPTYATKHIMVPRLFNNAYKSFELVEHTISSDDVNVRIVKTLTRPPVGAFIFFNSIAAENGPRNTTSAEYVTNTFNERWWPLNRQVVKITTWKDSLEQTLGTSEYMQWNGCSTRRLNREHLLRENRELSGSRTRQFNTFWADSSDFVKKPFIAIRFDNDVVDPATVKTTVTDTRYVTNEYIIELKFDFIDPVGAALSSDTTVMKSSMKDPRKLIAVFIYEHNFKSLGDNVISTQVN